MAQKICLFKHNFSTVYQVSSKNKIDEYEKIFEIQIPRGAYRTIANNYKQKLTPFFGPGDFFFYFKFYSHLCNETLFEMLEDVCDEFKQTKQATRSESKGTSEK